MLATHHYTHQKASKSPFRIHLALLVKVEKVDLKKEADGLIRHLLLFVVANLNMV
jgi:hypothetical protein